jgi:hypothetical protein
MIFHHHLKSKKLLVYLLFLFLFSLHPLLVAFSLSPQASSFPPAQPVVKQELNSPILSFPFLLLSLGLHGSLHLRSFSLPVVSSYQISHGSHK